MEKIYLDDYKKLELLFGGLHLAKSTSEDAENTSKATDDEPVSSDAPTINVKEDVTQCRTCAYVFQLREDQVTHYKSDWHRYNTKLKLNDLSPVSEENFEDIVDDVSSISGSDTETDTESDDDGPGTDDKDKLDKVFNKLQDNSQLLSNNSQNVPDKEIFHRRTPKVVFQNSNSKFLSLYKCILPYVEDDYLSNAEKISEFLQNPIKCCIILLSAGHFATAVFEGDKVKVHKTFHRYIVRAKQGTVQSVRDNASSAPKSGGASLRRHNEAALINDIQTLLTSWKSDYIDSCSHIFLRAPHYHKSIFYNGKTAPLSRKDPRIRGIPFPTRRPTFNEIKRVKKELYSVEVSDEDFIKGDTHVKRNKKVAKEPTNHVENEPKRKSSPKIEKVYESPRSRKKRQKRKKMDAEKTSLENEHLENIADDKVPEKEDLVSGVIDELFTVCKTGDLEGLKAVVASFHQFSNGVQIDGNSENEHKRKSTIEEHTIVILNQPIDNENNTLLHIAAKAGHRDIISFLLSEGADPTIKNKSLIVPYSVSSDKVMRNTFRKFMAEFPEKYDYKIAQIPAPLTEDMEKEQKKKLNEKKKVQKALKKEKQKELNAEKARKAKEEEEKERFVALSDREKRAIAAERRFAQQLAEKGSEPSSVKRCWLCGESMLGKIPFEYLDYQFCSMPCLKKHKLSQGK